jgi:hypothetical protein
VRRAGKAAAGGKENEEPPGRRGVVFKLQQHQKKKKKKAMAINDVPSIATPGRCGNDNYVLGGTKRDQLLHEGAEDDERRRCRPPAQTEMKRRRSAGSLAVSGRSPSRRSIGRHPGRSQRLWESAEGRRHCEPQDYMSLLLRVAVSSSNRTHSRTHIRTHDTDREERAELRVCVCVCRRENKLRTHKIDGAENMYNRGHNVAATPSARRRGQSIA